MTTKDAYWFSHDSNAKDDPKCMILIDQLGMEGYGIYWVLVETLRDQPGYRYPLNLLPILAKRYMTSGEKMKAVVMNYGLFEVHEEEFFFSPSLNSRMLAMDGKREQARQAGLASARKRKLLAESNDGLTDVEQPLNEGSTSKVNKSKVNKIIKEKLGDDFIEVVNEWLDYKKQIKDSYKSDKGIIALCTKIKNMSGGRVSVARDIIEQSMANNWKGLFELKDNGTHKEVHEPGANVTRLKMDAEGNLI